MHGVPCPWQAANRRQLYIPPKWDSPLLTFLPGLLNVHWDCCMSMTVPAPFKPSKLSLQQADQAWVQGNKALAISYQRNLPVRVVRGGVE